MITPTKTVCYLIDRDTGKPERLPIDKTIFILDSGSDYDIGIDGWIAINEKVRGENPLLDKVRIMVREEVVKWPRGDAKSAYLLSYSANTAPEYLEGVL